MKNLYKLVASVGLSMLAVGAMAQLTTGHMYKMSGKTPSAATTKIGHYNAKRSMSSTTLLLNYDSADAVLSSGMYYHNQGQLMNVNYVYPTDTAGGNANLINYISVAFDSLVDAYNSDAPYTASSIEVDTLVIPIVHTNHSGVADTLEVQINSVDTYGGPKTSTILKDTLIIGVKIGDTNSSSLINNIVIPENYIISTTPKFAVTVKYKGSKMDSCWFIYGFHYFTGGCPTGSFTLADPTTYSMVDSGTWANVAANKMTPMGPVNSWELWPGFLKTAELPSNLLFIDCNGDGKFNAGDAANYFENINILALVTTDPTGVNSLSANGFKVAQNAPNPFNRNTQINYTLAKNADVNFSVYDMTGRVLIENTYSNVAPGQHTVNLTANQFTPGVYFYSFKINGNVVTKRMIITE